MPGMHRRRVYDRGAGDPRSTREPRGIRRSAPRFLRPGDEAIPRRRRARGAGAEPGGPRRRDLRPRRAFRVWEDDRDADGEPDGRDHRRRHPGRGHLGEAAQPGRAAAAHRLRDSADRAVPAPHDRRQRGHGPAPARLAEGADRGPGAGAARPRAARPRDGRALPVAALRWPAAARGRRSRAGGQPRPDADGRALRRRRPDQPREAPERVPPPAGGGAEDDPVRHPRHRRGDQDGRPDRRAPAREGGWRSTRLPPSC